MNTEHLYWAAYEYGHNLWRLRGHQLDEYAQAYADVSSEARVPFPLHTFTIQWQRGHIVPRPSGTYYYDPYAVTHAYHEENGRVVAACPS